MTSATRRDPHEPGSSLSEALAELQRALARHRRGAVAGLNRPATIAKRAALARELLGKSALPAPLDAWFAWHDGGGEGVELDGYRPLSTIEAIDVRDRLASSPDGAPRLQPSWVPILECAGMLLLYVGAPPRRGALLHRADFLGDCRPIAPSLLAWVRRVTKTIERQAREASKRPALATPRFERTGAPSAADLRRAPVGTLCHHACALYGGAPGHRVYAKVGPDRWVWVQDATREGATKWTLREYARRARDDWDVGDADMAEMARRDAPAGSHFHKAPPRQG